MTQPVRADAPLILIADDVPANVELLIDQLHTLGYRTVSAEDGPSDSRMKLSSMASSGIARWPV